MSAPRHGAPQRGADERLYLARLARDDTKPPEARARAVLIGHQRTDAGCTCGWGHAPQHVGRSFAAHLLDELRAARLAVVASDTGG